MKIYGANKATEFTKRDLSPIYKAAKAGELKVEKWFMNALYDLAEYYGFDDNGTVEEREKDVLRILTSDNQQEEITATTEKWFAQHGKKARSSFNREYVG